MCTCTADLEWDAVVEDGQQKETIYKSVPSFAIYLILLGSLSR